jgi:glyoxylase-like metal-dependent hydrolase (beta-lactamase superfamily II)
LEEAQSEHVWLIDIGSDEFVIPPGKQVKGVFLTHTHIDHIQGINKLIATYPDCIIYTNKFGIEGLFDDRKNLTYYHEKPLNFRGGHIHEITDGDIIHLFEDHELQVMETPGHHPSCISYKVDNFMFTGDSYIPNIPVVTKLKGGDKLQAQQSVTRLLSVINNETIICAGHGGITYPKLENDLALVSTTT